MKPLTSVWNFMGKFYLRLTGIDGVMKMTNQIMVTSVTIESANFDHLSRSVMSGSASFAKSLVQIARRGFRGTKTNMLGWVGVVNDTDKQPNSQDLDSPKEENDQPKVRRSKRERKTSNKWKEFVCDATSA
ncbi:hypothetical protein E3N88_14535 [Mikania micrantha]|uniref:Uncharacterized protein n=1 Tax=Mikania micrantha TaxID=192012 RepID=A0A5N6P4S4_9ASTR|nr:hypothetical protein E3N88_14535 [Mikania micrantha]